MLPHKHIVLGFFFAVLLLFLYPQFSLLSIFTIFASSILVDIDHYLLFVSRKREFSLAKAFNYFLDLRKLSGIIKKEKKSKSPVYIFHTLEFFIFLILLSIFIPQLIFVLVGLSFHYITDIIEMTAQGAAHFREYSIILWAIRRKSKEWKYY